MRVFLGISVPEELKARIISVQDRFLNFDVKFVEKENFHFNLKFFEDIDEERVNQLKRILEDIAKQFQPFEIRIAGIGAFPSVSYARVLWLGVKDGYQTLTSMAEMIEKALESMGFETEEKFVPHLTLGRVRSERNKNEMLILLRRMEEVEVGKMEVKELKLFQSKLSPKGPVYEEIFKSALGLH